MDLRSILDWSTDALKAEKLLENNIELEIETSLDDDKEPDLVIPNQSKNL